jgi:hypothetical protein
MSEELCPLCDQPLTPGFNDSGPELVCHNYGKCTMCGLRNSPRMIAAIRAKIAINEVDALRYRWLRHGDNDQYVIRDIYGKPYDRDKHMPYLLRIENLDRAIDAQIKAETGRAM